MRHGFVLYTPTNSYSATIFNSIIISDCALGRCLPSLGIFFSPSPRSLQKKTKMMKIAGAPPPLNIITYSMMLLFCSYREQEGHKAHRNGTKYISAGEQRTVLRHETLLSSINDCSGAVGNVRLSAWLDRFIFHPQCCSPTGLHRHNANGGLEREKNGWRL